MTLEQWLQVGLPSGLVIALFLFATKNVWPWYVKHQSEIDKLAASRQAELDKQLDLRHTRYLESIDAIKAAIYSQAQTNLTVGNEHAALLAGITKHLEDADKRILIELEKSKEEIISHIDRVIGSGLKPRKSNPKPRN